ncbi:hypothetical protein MSA03_27780 [Microbacterium saccharophilum]|uniref:hypothetical protein n=1 Tax=Microbacterium saccharophilum TaxID=1213358 RepID=UPI0011914EEA|nr:hypothetical protein [Microbacterium saccharophilum]GEP49270.1 hypothetical protein MSA03_27780 [Microbacterium saccharophilum]
MGREEDAIRADVENMMYYGAESTAVDSADTLTASGGQRDGEVIFLSESEK